MYISLGLNIADNYFITKNSINIQSVDADKKRNKIGLLSKKDYDV